MRTALIEAERLLSPAAGEWFAEVSLGSPIAPGARLGRLRRAGAWLDVIAPEGVSGAALPVPGRGAWVAAGDVLLELGVGGAGVRAAAAHAPTGEGPPPGAVVVRAETDGTIYLRPDPNAAAFAGPGARVAGRATLALIEVMKTFSPVRAAADGEVLRVLVVDGAAVTEGQALFWVGPPAA